VHAGPSGEQGRPEATPSRMEKPVELMAFELGKEVMDTLRTRHTHISSILEVILQELGALTPHSALGVVVSLSIILRFRWTTKAGQKLLLLTEVPDPKNAR
jgi:hypothetical protein